MASRTSAPKVGTTTSIAISELSLHPENARRGDVPTIRASLLAHGQYKPIVGNIGTHTGRPREILVGNHTLKAMRDLAEDPEVGESWSTALVHWVDVDDDKAKRILLIDNRASEVGGFDNEALFALVESLADDLTGTGYTDDDLADLDALAQERNLDGIDPFDAGPKDKKTKTGDDGLIDVPHDVDENKDRYADSATRLVIMTLPIARFVWAQEQLAKYRAAFDLDNNTDALVLLLESWSGEDAPARDAVVSEAAVEEAAAL